MNDDSGGREEREREARLEEESDGDDHDFFAVCAATIDRSRSFRHSCHKDDSGYHCDGGGYYNDTSQQRQQPWQHQPWQHWWQETPPGSFFEEEPSREMPSPEATERFSPPTDKNPQEETPEVVCEAVSRFISEVSAAAVSREAPQPD